MRNIVCPPAINSPNVLIIGFGCIAFINKLIVNADLRNMRFYTSPTYYTEFYQVLNGMPERLERSDTDKVHFILDNAKVSAMKL